MTAAPLLTPREVEVLEAYCRLGSARRVAAELQLHEQTVKNHLLMARQRSGVDSTVQLVAAAILSGVIFRDPVLT